MSVGHCCLIRSLNLSWPRRPRKIRFLGSKALNNRFMGPQGFIIEVLGIFTGKNPTRTQEGSGWATDVWNPKRSNPEKRQVCNSQCNIDDTPTTSTILAATTAAAAASAATTATTQRPQQPITVFRRLHVCCYDLPSVQSSDPCVQQGRGNCLALPA